MSAEWLKIAWSCSDSSIEIVNHIKAVAAQRRYRMAEAVFSGV
jgi:hypothetical protein